MTSILKVDTIQDQSGNNIINENADTITIGASGDVIAVPAGSAAAPVITTTGDTNTGMFFPAADTIAFTEGGTEAMRIDSSGNVGIGTSSPANKFHVSGLSTLGGIESTYSQLSFISSTNANSYTLQIKSTSATPLSQYVCDILFTGSTPNNTLARFLTGTDTTNEKFAILSTGGFLSRNNSYGSYSDIKLKENIVNATSKLEDIMKLNVRNFNFKDNPNQKQIGFIAQEFEQVFPSLIEECSEKSKDGEALETTTKTIKTSILIPILTKAIQEQQAIIEELKARITALENN
jgi:hypothetical protein